MEKYIRLLQMIRKHLGSTTKQYLSQRFDTHRSIYKFWQTHKTGSKTMAFRLFDQYGIDNCKIVLLEKVVSDSKDELRIREQHYIDTLDCVNRYKACVPDRDIYLKEWRESNKDVLQIKKKEYYETNKEVIAVEQKDYREANKEAIAKKKKIYQDANKEAIKVYEKKYYESNRESIAQKQKKYKQENKDKYVCAYCDYHSHELSKLERHKNTKKHKTNLLKGITTWLSEHRK